ncbi:MAG: methyltransferase [Deltaproteobacteria bacterium]|nr:methyltransferase [Deltaproteobacteria bacterium]
MTLTRDGLFHGRLTVLQPERGYRFAVDSVLLGAFSSSIRSETCVDLGSGCGVVGFILLGRGRVQRVVGVELDPVLASASSEGARENAFDDRYRVIEGDLREAGWRVEVGKVGLVVTNPPYHVTGKGRTSPDEGRARGRHDATCTLDDVLDAASSLLEPRGRLCVVLPPERMGEFLAGASARGLFASRLRPVYSKPGRPSRMVLLEVRTGAGSSGLVLETPLLLHDVQGEYTLEARDILAGKL